MRIDGPVLMDLMLIISISMITGSILTRARPCPDSTAEQNDKGIGAYRGGLCLEVIADVVDDRLLVVLVQNPHRAFRIEG